MILDFLHIGWGNLYVIGHPAWLQKAKQGRPTTAKASLLPNLLLAVRAF